MYSSKFKKSKKTFSTLPIFFHIELCMDHTSSLNLQCDKSLFLIDSRARDSSKNEVVMCEPITLNMDTTVNPTCCHQLMLEVKIL